MREPELKSANDAVCNGAASYGEGRGHGDHGNGNGGDGGCCRTGGVDGGGPLASLVPPKGSPTAKAPAQAEGEEEARDSSQEDVAFHQLALSAEAFALLAGLYRRISRAAAGGNAGGVVGGWVAAWEQLGLVLVPAAWLCVNMVPLMMVLAYARLPDSLPLSTLYCHRWPLMTSDCLPYQVLAYARLPHAHRVQSAVVSFGWRLH